MSQALLFFSNLSPNQKLQLAVCLLLFLMFVIVAGVRVFLSRRPSQPRYVVAPAEPAYSLTPLGRQYLTHASRPLPHKANRNQ